MTLSARLNAMEKRIKALEERAKAIDEALADEVADEQQESLTLDGDRIDAGERDQTQSLG
jgi:hypothetical protein